MSKNPRVSQTPGAAEENSGTIESMPSFGTGELDSEHGVVLKDWSAQDFASIYVRFRPHLIGHARKFLREEAQAEEVVQDAFLYLMTALPELDSELGVLRFLKWKTRLLCLDLIRAQGANPIFGASPLEDSTASFDLDPTESIERADDAAIVRLALAQLSPRHREAIVATVFEEKSTQQAAQEMGLSENAFRQLLLRARRTFKTVFVGEVETADMSVSEALNLAAKRHRLKLISGGSFVLILILGFGAPWGDTGPSTTQVPAQVAQSRLGVESDSLSGGEPSEFQVDGAQEEVSGGQLNVGLPVDTRAETVENVPVVAPALGGPSESLGAAASDNSASAEEGMREELRVLLASEITENPLLVSKKGDTYTSLSSDELVLRQAVSENLTLIVHVADCGDNLVPRPCKIYFEDTRNGNSLVWLAQTLASEQLRGESSVPTLDVVATDFLVGDFGGAFGNIAINANEVSALEYLRFELTVEGSSAELNNVTLLKSTT